MASSYQQKFPVPDGFPEHLHDLMKAILREQPSDIVEYSYQYFKNMSEGKGEPQAERKNYYGDQMEKQKTSGTSQVIPKPTASTNQQRGKSAKSEQKSHKSGGTQKTITTNQTHKGVGTDYVGELADKAIEIYEGVIDGPTE